MAEFYPTKAQSNFKKEIDGQVSWSRLAGKFWGRSSFTKHSILIRKDSVELRSGEMPTTDVFFTGLISSFDQ
jgi:hypothetical protein